MKYKENCEILEKTEICKNIFKFKISTENIAKEASSK